MNIYVLKHLCLVIKYGKGPTIVSIDVFGFPVRGDPRAKRISSVFFFSRPSSTKHHSIKKCKSASLEPNQPFTFDEEAADVIIRVAH